MPHVDQWRATCFHEAAHAVFAQEVCGFKVHYVSAEEYYTAVRELAFGGWADYWRLAMYTLAGSFAEQLEIWGEIRPEPLEEVLSGYEIELEDLETFEEHPGDTLYLVKYLKAMSADPMDGDLEENYRIVVKDTEEEVRRRWSEIKAVAEMLERCGRLEGEEVAALIAPQQPPK